jgi:hypothetical protein
MNKQYFRYRIIQTSVRDNSIYIVQWNDRWFFGLYGFWHDKFMCSTLEEAKLKIKRIIEISKKNKES